MKAAILHNFGEVPKFKEFPNPVPAKDDVLIQIKAVHVENVGKDETMTESTIKFGNRFWKVSSYGYGRNSIQA